MKMNILAEAKAFAKNGQWEKAMGLVKTHWDDYEEIIEPYEDGLMELFSMASLDCCFEVEF